MVELRPLADLTGDDLKSIGEGYTSHERYRVNKSESDGRIVISLELEQLPEPFVKAFPVNSDDLSLYREYVATGRSIGAYQSGTLIGLAIVEQRRWNNTLWLWDIRVGKPYRCQGIGRRLLERVIENAAAMGCRAVGLECQSPNVPAIKLYRSLGFELDGVDLSLYTNDDVEKGEVCFFMRKKLGVQWDQRHSGGNQEQYRLGPIPVGVCDGNRGFST